MKKFKEGDLVVVNNLEDATVYLLTRFNEKRTMVWLVELSPGDLLAAGSTDKSFLRRPTKVQLENALSNLYLTTARRKGIHYV